LKNFQKFYETVLAKVNTNTSLASARFNTRLHSLTVAPEV